MSFLDRYQPYDDREQVQIGNDWKDDPIFEGETCYNIEGVYVFEDDLKEYIEDTFGKATQVMEGSL